ARFPEVVVDPRSRMSSAAWQRCERAVQRFEQAWLRGENPTLEDFLPEAAALRQAVLVELARADLGRRLEAGEQMRVESYLGRHPELAADPDAVLGLVLAELTVRRRCGDVALEEYHRRFPSLKEQIAAHAADAEALTVDGC